LAILETIAENENLSSLTSGSQQLPDSSIVENNQNTNETFTPQRNDLLNKYLMIEDPEMAKIEGDFEDPWTYCEECGTEMNMCLNEAVLTCPQCGFQENILVDSDKPSYKDPPRENSYYAYKKINHFNEWLAQFQAKETTEIPQDIYDSILVELKKERITDMSMLKKEKIKEILRKMNKSKYYEHVTHIINRLNGRNAPHMSRENEEKLRHMFREIQPSFVKHKPKGRRNFLSYSYVFYKFCELLEMDEFLGQFSLLKNRDKLYLQDQTWKLICQDMGWQYIRTLG
jgi:predicted amidophosphoribosyltransferase